MIRERGIGGCSWDPLPSRPSSGDGDSHYRPLPSQATIPRFVEGLRSKTTLKGFVFVEGGVDSLATPDGPGGTRYLVPGGSGNDEAVHGRGEDNTASSAPSTATSCSLTSTRIPHADIYTSLLLRSLG